MVIGGEEKGKAIAGGSGVNVGDGERESCREGGSDVGIGVVESDWIVVNYGAGARGRNSELFGEADNAIAEVGIAEESEVSDVERTEIEANTLSSWRSEEKQEKGKNKEIFWGH